MKKEVRFATIGDIDFIYDSLQADFKEQGVLHRFKYSKQDFKAIAFGDKPVANFLVLWIDDKPSGFANYSIDFRNFTANIGSNLYLNDVYVEKQYRCMGGGILLLDKIKEIARSEQCGRIEFIVLAENTIAINFYKKHLNSTVISDRLHYMRLEL